MPTKRSHWLMKSEPDVYSIDDLARDGRAEWEGVRNYQARNFMRDGMRVGDLVLFYHSNANPPGVAGVARVCRGAYPDPTQFDPKSPYHDPKSPEDAPRWLMVDVEFVHKFDAVVSLSDLKADGALSDMKVVQRGQRLSVQPVDAKHFKRVLNMAGAKLRV
jgi:predicted RNA-binding protein with PUA-like domain